MRKPHVILTEADFVGVMALQPHSALQDELERATIVPAAGVPPGVVTMNSRVRYFDEHTGVCREIELVYPEHADIADAKVSVLAPVGTALLGLEVGQSIDWPFPSGEMRRLRVQQVLDPPAVRRADADDGSSTT
jgi:regulator of nucleoside diphosphate kinase